MTLWHDIMLLIQVWEKWGLCKSGFCNRKVWLSGEKGATKNMESLWLKRTRRMRKKASFCKPVLLFQWEIYFDPMGYLSSESASSFPGKIHLAFDAVVQTALGHFLVSLVLCIILKLDGNEEYMEVQLLFYYIVVRNQTIGQSILFIWNILVNSTVNNGEKSM